MFNCTFITLSHNVQVETIKCVWCRRQRWKLWYSLNGIGWLFVRWLVLAVGGCYHFTLLNHTRSPIITCASKRTQLYDYYYINFDYKTRFISFRLCTLPHFILACYSHSSFWVRYAEWASCSVQTAMRDRFIQRDTIHA